MSLGNNRDYKTAGRRARNNLKRHAELMNAIIKNGCERDEASKLALTLMETSLCPRCGNREATPYREGYIDCLCKGVPR